MVPGVGVELLMRTDIAQLIDSTKSQNGEKPQKRRSQVRGGYTGMPKHQFVGTAKQNDDMTVIVVRVAA